MKKKKKKKISASIANDVLQFSKFIENDQLTLLLCFHTTLTNVVHITVDVLKPFVKYLLFFFVSYNNSFLIMLMFQIVLSC